MKSLVLVPNVSNRLKAKVYGLTVYFAHYNIIFYIYISKNWGWDTPLEALVYIYIYIYIYKLKLRKNPIKF